MLRIRKFQSGDAQAVSDLIRITMERSNTRDYPVDRLRPLIDYFSPAKVSYLNMDRYCLVAELDAVVVGTAAIEGETLCTFFVHLDHQNCGIGTRLLSAIELAALDLGVDRLTADASLTGTSFYERHGYRRTGKTIHGVAGAQIKVEKRLKLS